MSLSGELLNLRPGGNTKRVDGEALRVDSVGELSSVIPSSLLAGIRRLVLNLRCELGLGERLGLSGILVLLFFESGLDLDMSCVSGGKPFDADTVLPKLCSFLVLP